MSNQGYTSVPTSEAATHEARRRRTQRQDAVEAISNKIHALLWTLGGALTLFLTDFFNVVITDPRVSW